MTFSLRQTCSDSPPVARNVLRVPEVGAAFWIAKSLSTAFGESASDWLVNVMDPRLAVLLGFVAFALALIWKLTIRQYSVWPYWLTVVMVGVFGTMCADVVHVAFGVAYPVSTALYAAALAAVFLVWFRTEKSLSIHGIDSTRKELFYWCAVVATFAMGTALGDLTAYTLHFGYLGSMLVFAALIVLPATGYRWFEWNTVAAFWIAYVLTRPLGASVADWIAKPRAATGLGYGDGVVVGVLGAAIVAVVGYVAVRDRRSRLRSPSPRRPSRTSSGHPLA